MGTKISWQIVPAGNRIFLKPVEEDAYYKYDCYYQQENVFF